jgi:putative glutamine transport system substrate-binding protein
MKKIIAIGAMALLSAVALFANGTTETAPKTEVDKIKARGVFTVGCKEDVPNFGYKNIQTGKVEGFEIDLANKIGEKILGPNPKIDFVGVTAKTRGPLLDTGELDAVVATFTVTDERRKSWDFSDIYYVDSVAVMVKKSKGFKSFKDLDGKTIGVAQSSTTKKSLEAEAQKEGITLKYSEFATYPEIKVALDSGRIDAFSVDLSILAGYMEDSCMLLPERFAPQQYGAAVKKGNAALLKVINDTIEELKASGELDKMQENWHLK